LTVEDAVEFDMPQTFAGALVTGGKWKQLSADELLSYQNGEAVRVHSGGHPWTLQSEAIQGEPSRDVNPTRLGLNWDEPVSSAPISLTITPAAAPAD
jgi:hypothetical protein